MSDISQAEKDAIKNAAIALGQALVAVKNLENRDIAVANALDIISLASGSDGYSALANCAVDIRVQAQKNINDAESLPDLLREYSRRDAELREANRINKCSERATA